MNGDVSGVVGAAGGHAAELDAVIGAVGAARCAEIAAAEIAFRTEAPRLAGAEVSVQLVFGWAGETVERLLTVTDSGVAQEPGRVAEPDVTVWQELEEVLRQLFGPRGAATGATRRVALRDSGDISSFRRPPVWFAVAQRVLATLDHRDEVTLTELASRYESDKWGIHRYTQHYPRYLEPLRDRPLTVLEIGIGGFADPAAGGASLRMWAHYFPRATVYGLDVHDKSPHDRQRIHTLRGDQSSPADLLEVVRRTGPLDLIIDDGSHRSEHVLTTFHTLFPHLRPGGCYAIEDLQTSYWPRFGGTSAEFDSPHTSVGFLKSLVDGLNHEEVLVDSGREALPTDSQIRGLPQSEGCTVTTTWP